MDFPSWGCSCTSSPVSTKLSSRAQCNHARTFTLLARTRTCRFLSVPSAENVIEGRTICRRWLYQTKWDKTILKELTKDKFQKCLEQLYESWSKCRRRVFWRNVGLKFYLCSVKVFKQILGIFNNILKYLICCSCKVFLLDFFLINTKTNSVQLLWFHNFLNFL